MTSDPKIPKWRAVADDLRRAINDGTYPAGSTLPPLKEYAAELGVHHETVRAAYKTLEKEGLIQSIRRRGSVVLEKRLPRPVPRTNTVTRDPARGYVFPAASRPDEPWQLHGQPFRKMVPAIPEVAEHFGLEAGTDVLRRRRVTSPAGEPPFQLVDTWISPEGVADAPRVADPSPGPGGYLDRLEEAGHGPLSWHETVQARMPEAEEARLLGISTSLPVIETLIVGTSAKTRKPIEVTIRVIPSNRVQLTMDLQRGSGATWPVTPVEPPQEN